MSINHVLTNNNNKTNWMTANNLENVVYKISGNGKEYVFSNPNSFAKFLNTGQLGLPWLTDNQNPIPASQEIAAKMFCHNVHFRARPL